MLLPGAAAAPAGSSHCAAASGAAGGATASGATASERPEFEGRVVSVNRKKRVFRLRAHSGRTLRFKVKRFTEFDDLRGFRSLRKGMRVEVDARRSHGRWIALEVDREGR